MLLDNFIHVILHVADEISKSDGKTTVNDDGEGLLVGKFIVRPTLIN